MRGLLLCSAVVSIAVYTTALVRLFTRPDGLQPGMRLLSLSATATAVIHLAGLAMLPLEPADRVAISLLLYGCGQALFVWAWLTIREAPLPIAFSRTPPTVVIVSGPYALVRHPFYAAYTMTWLAGVLATTHWLLWSSGMWMAVLYLVAARQEERMLRARSAVTYRAEQVAWR